MGNKRYQATGLLVVFLIIGFAWVNWKAFSSPVSAASINEPIAQSDKPVNNWLVCRDLGVGPVPGLTEPRQRVRLCHASGWKVDTYCLRPDLPVPILGTSCTRTGALTYFCGNGLQPLREYNIQETPPPPATETPTPTATATQTPTVTSTPTQVIPTEVTLTPIPTQRPKPGGDGYSDLIKKTILKLFSPPRFAVTVQEIAPSPTPFRPLHPTPVYTLVPSQLIDRGQIVSVQSNSDFYGLKTQDDQPRLRIRIKPDNRQVNSGKPVEMSFRSSTRCKFGDGNGCANVYRDSAGNPIVYFTVHSGIGGEAQTLRNALEGTGFDQAGLSLKQVKRNLQMFVNSQVSITQGDLEINNLEVAAAVRLPAKMVKNFIDTPVDQALAYAAQIDPSILPYIQPGEPIVVIETCGWRMPGESSRAGVSDTSASIYLLIIRSKKN